MNYIHILTYLAFLFLWMSAPGPCFALVARNSMKYGIKAGIWTSFGMIICDTIFITLAVIGVAEFLSHHPKILNAGKIIGAAYIFYIGIDILLSTFRKKAEDEILQQDTLGNNSKLILRGFLTDASNPLLIMGMLAIVLRFIDSSWSSGHILFYAVLIPFTTLYVNFSIAIIFGNSITRRFVLPYMKWFERFAGFAISILAILMIIE